MKKFITNLVLVICLCATLLCACGKSGLKDNPATDAQIYGNGGYAVVKGDYLYYTNGFVSDYTTSLSNYKKDNDFGKVTYGAIYRTKLDGSKISKDDNGFLTSTERVVPKVVGFDNGGFYIVGDYIYYGTPYMQKNADGKLQNDRVSFNRIKIDGTGNKEFYVSGEDVKDIEWKVYNYNGNAYLVVVEDKKVTSVYFEGKKVVTKQLAKETTSVVLNDSTTPLNDFVYYTRAIGEDEKGFSTSGNLLCRASFVSGTETAYEDSQSKVLTYTVVGYSNNKIYYTAKNSIAYLYAQNASESLNSNSNKPIQLSDTDYSNYYFIAGGNPYSVAALNSDKELVLITNINGAPVPTAVASNISTVVGVRGDYVYYIDSSLLKRVNLTDRTTETVSNVGDASGKTFMLSDVNTVDIGDQNDDRFVYIFASYTSATKETDADGKETEIKSYYLNRIDLLTGEKVAEFVGVMDKNHLPAEPTADETTGKKDKWIY